MDAEREECEFEENKLIEMEKEANAKKFIYALNVDGSYSNNVCFDNYSQCKQFVETHGTETGRMIGDTVLVK